MDGDSEESTEGQHAVGAGKGESEIDWDEFDGEK